MDLARFLGPALCAVVLLPAQPAPGAEPRDPYFAEALFHAYQGHFFDALQRLDVEIAQHRRVDEPELDPLYPHIQHAEFSVGDFELHYRMHHRAGRAIRAVLEAEIEEPIRNDAAYRLARLHFQKQQPREAFEALERIEGHIPDEIRNEIEFLRSNLYLATAQPEVAVETLRALETVDGLGGYAAYNLGIALLELGQGDQAAAQLGRAGQLEARERGTLAIRDKANLILGKLLFESSDFEGAGQALDRVRLDGPFSNQALLRAGWASVSSAHFDRAVVPWSLLAEREATDAAVQEALLALPYAYGQLGVHGRAALLYGQAVTSFDQELEKVALSIASIRDGKFLEALVREEIRHRKDWVIRLRSLPETPETFYLVALMASHDFQTALQNYLDLEDLRKRLVGWDESLDAFDDLIEVRRRYYEPILPGIDGEFRRLDARIRLRQSQREQLDKRLQHQLIAPRPDYLATADERILAQRLEELAAVLGDGSEPGVEAQRLRIRRLQGVLVWQWQNEYHERLTEAHEHLRELNQQIAEMTERYRSFVRVRQAATHSYSGYSSSIEALRARVGESLERLHLLRTRQGHLLERVAVEELTTRRERLVTYRNQARFAFADSYDRAAKMRVE